MSIRVGFGPRSSAPLIWIKRTGALRRCEGRQADDECGVTFVLSTFEAAAEPSEGSVVEVEPPLAEGGGIEPFAAVGSATGVAVTRAYAAGCTGRE